MKQENDQVARLLRAARQQQRPSSALATRRTLAALRHEGSNAGLARALRGDLAMSPRATRALYGATISGSALALAPAWLLQAEFIALPFCALAGGALAYAVARLFLKQRLHRTMHQEIDIAAAFDNIVERHLPALPDKAAAGLLQLRQTLATLLPALALAKTHGWQHDDDNFFLEQLTQRYLPDALGEFSMLPAAAGTGEHRQQAEALLLEQLEKLQLRVERITANLAAFQLARMQQHGKFLARSTEK